jgi:hypothetical protein
MFTGWNNNISRGLSKYGGKNTPSMTNLMKAQAIVAGQGFDAIFHENLMNGFNMTYNISGRATAEMKETLRA